MDESDNIELKRELANRFVYFPLLRVLIFSFWFRLVFAGFFLSLIFLALFLPKIWRVTPRGFLPVIKISGLDMVQAWSLQRSALRSMSAGDFERAVYAWQAAVANNPARPELLRGALRNLLQLGRPDPKYQAAAVGQAVWLLRLTGTNAADVELAAQIFDEFELHDLVLRLLVPVDGRLSSPEEAAFLKALFHAGQMAQFASRWENLGEKRSSLGPGLQLYHAAYLAGWGSPSNARDGRRELEAALADPRRRMLANRLRLIVCAHASDAEGYQESLRRLEQLQGDTLLEHVIYWQLLATLGRQDEARALARMFARPPVSAWEARRLAESCIALGLRDEARQFVQRHLADFGSSPDLWALQAHLLIEEKRWEELRALALQLRQQPAVRDTLAEYSYYLEGRAELGLERRAVAESAFAKAAQRPFEDRALGLATAVSLLKLGFPAVARDILLPLETDLAASAEYWQALFAAARALKDAPLMVTAAGKAYQLLPGDVVWANNYAAALLVNRERTDEAIKLTLRLLNRFPHSAPAKINHGLALLFNRRTSEAETLFQSIDTAKLSALENTALDLGLFEVYFDRHEYDKARETSDRIDVNYLFPNQLKWLEEARRRIPQPHAAK